MFIINNIDELDEKIIKELQKDARQSFREISKSVGATTATVINRVAKMENKGIINGYYPDIDYKKIGYGTAAVIHVIIRDEKGLEHVKKAVSDSHTLGVYEVSGDSDAIIIAKFKTTEDLRKYIRKYLLGKESITKISTQFIMNITGEKSIVNL